MCVCVCVCVCVCGGGVQGGLGGLRVRKVDIVMVKEDKETGKRRE